MRTAMTQRTESERQALLASGASKLPRPRLGPYYIDGLGGIFDWIFRTKARERKAKEELEPFLMTEDEMEVWLEEASRQAAREESDQPAPSSGT